jgi:large subunit ribosomal protein L4
MLEVMNNLQVAGKKVLFVLPENNYNVIKSASNIQRTNVVTVNELNTYAIMNSSAVVFVENAVAALESTLA